VKLKKHVDVNVVIEADPKATVPESETDALRSASAMRLFIRTRLAKA
jgi:hypothetical protein